MNTLTRISILCLSLTVLGGCNEDQESANADTPATDSAPESYTADPDTAAPPEPTEQEITCYDCGTVTDITAVSVDGAGSGAGAVIGAVAGGLLGNQVGGGSGKKIATVVGAVGGAFAGNEVEKKTRKQTYYDVTVEMDSGGSRTISVASAQQLSIGTPVRVVGNNLELL